MLWAGGNDNSDESQDSTDGGYAGLYRWTVDALFGSRVSPSKKYKEFAQDDTNYKHTRRYAGANIESPPLRSNSWSELDSTFYRRNDLLPPSLGSEVDEVPRRRSSRSLQSPLISTEEPERLREQVTDTFAGRRKKLRDPLDDDEFSIKFQSPRRDDPVISKLFESSFADNKAPESTKRVPIPGKFPSPLKQTTREKDYTADYLQILDQLSRNERLLEEVNRDFGEKQAQIQAKERGYREKYLQTRTELIEELKHSKKLYDNYYKLYAKYQQLRELSQHAVQMRTKVSALESQIVDDAIGKEKQIHDLTRKVFELELKLQDSNSMRERDASRYNARILELEKQVSLQSDAGIGVSSLSFSPSRYGDQSSDYNAMVDSQFLKNLN